MNHPVLLPKPRHFNFYGSDLLDAGTLRQDPEVVTDSNLPQEGYRLEVTASGVHIASADAAGAFYAKKTLDQLILHYGDGECPSLSIEDYPELPLRGVMLDISRDRIPVFADLLAFVDWLAGLKINCFMLYMEHTFAYRDHSVVWKDASPMTAEEIRKLDQYCKARFIQLIPMQSTLGHMLRWLSHEPYRALAECPEGIASSWQMEPTDPFSFCPTDPQGLKFIEGLLDELLPNFTDHRFMACCDETYDIGKGRSAQACQEQGTAQVYLDYICSLHKSVTHRQRQMMIFADMVKDGQADISKLPEDIILVDWGYGRNYPFEAHGKEFSKHSRSFVFMVSNSNYSSAAGRTYRWRGNIENAVGAACRNGGEGVITAEWGDFGHWHPWTLSLPGFAFGAAMSWGPEKNADVDIAQAIDRLAFNGAEGLGAIIIDMGKIYAHVAGKDDTDALYWQFYQRKRRKGEVPLERLTLDGLKRVEEDCRDIESRLERLKLEGFERAELEIRVGLKWLRFGCNCARAWLLDSDAKYLSDLPPAVQRPLAAEFESLISALIKLRDGKYRPGGRAAAIGWLKRFWQTVCGAVPFPEEFVEHGVEGRLSSSRF